MFLGPPGVSTPNRISIRAAAFTGRKRVTDTADKITDRQTHHAWEHR